MYFPVEGHLPTPHPSESNPTGVDWPQVAGWLAAIERVAAGQQPELIGETTKLPAQLLVDRENAEDYEVLVRVRYANEFPELVAEPPFSSQEMTAYRTWLHRQTYLP